MSDSNLIPRLRKKAVAPPPPKPAPPPKGSKPPVPPTPPQPKTTRGVRWRVEDSLDRPGEAPPDTFPYWMVWNKHKKRMPVYRHPTKDSARTEAVRLSQLEKNAGFRFYIVQIEGFEFVEPSV